MSTFADMLKIVDRGRSSKGKKVGNNTWARMVGDKVTIRLHNTDIMFFHPNGVIELNSGGFKTATTKARMNEHMPAGWGVSQSNGVWYLCHWQGAERNLEEHPFADGMMLSPEGTVIYENGKPPDPKASIKLRKKAREYARAYIEALDKGEVPEPSNGDCWYCCMRVVTPEADKGKPLGEATHNDHVLVHMDEKYYVPSLLMRATEVFPVSQVAKWYLGWKWGKGEDVHNWGDIAKDQLRKALYRYVLRSLGEVT